MAEHDELKLLLQRLADQNLETQQSIFSIDKKLDLHIQKTEYELRGINDQDAIQNKLLDQHIEGVNTLKEIFQQHEKNDVERFQKLEEPRKFSKWAVGVLLTLGSVVGSIAAIGKHLGWF